MFKYIYSLVSNHLRAWLVPSLAAMSLIIGSSCASVWRCRREVPTDKPLLSITQYMRGAVSYTGHFAKVSTDGIRMTGFRRRRCSRMDPAAFRALKDLLASEEFRREYAVTEARNYAHMGGDEPLLIAEYDGRWTSIAFSRLSTEGLTPLLKRADELIEGNDKIQNGTAAFPNEFGPWSRGHS
jgi:hypothetical protein